MVELFLQGIGYRKGIEGEEMKEVVSGMLATMKEEMGSTLKDELRLFKKEIESRIISLLRRLMRKKLITLHGQRWSKDSYQTS